MPFKIHLSQTILDNVKYGNKDVSLNDVEKATKELGDRLYKFIDDGFNTVMDKEVQTIYGTKRTTKYLACPEADTQYLILDEATSS